MLARSAVLATTGGVEGRSTRLTELVNVVEHVDGRHLELLVEVVVVRVVKAVEGGVDEIRGTVTVL